MFEAIAYSLARGAVRAWLDVQREQRQVYQEEGLTDEESYVVSGIVGNFGVHEQTSNHTKQDEAASGDAQRDSMADATTTIIKGG